jgi:hypothetical protein
VHLPRLHKPRAGASGLAVVGLRCTCGHLHASHAYRRVNVCLEVTYACTVHRCACSGYRRQLAAVRLQGPPDLDLCRKTDYTGELK